MVHKRMAIFPAAAAFGLLWASCAVAQDGGGTPAPQAGNTKSEKTPKRICRAITPSGSRLTTRRCMSQADWDARQDKTQEGVLKYQTDNTTQYEHAGGPG